MTSNKAEYSAGEAIEEFTMQIAADLLPLSVSAFLIVIWGLLVISKASTKRPGSPN